MIRNVLTHTGGVEVYGIISILLFFVFFTGMLIWAYRLRRDHLEAMGRLPLDGGDQVAHHGSESQTQDRR
jgi:cytochrome c oxidase cbb3-type subunit 4